MKFKTILGLSALLFGANAFAENPSSKFCANQIVKNPAYGIVMSSKTMKYKFTNLYMTVDSEIEKYFQVACKKNLPMSQMADEAETVCVKTCDKNADSYTDGKLVGKKEFGREIFNECASICFAMRNMHVGYIQGLADASKASNDCVNPNKDAISTMGRVVKKIEESSVPAKKNGHNSLEK